MALFFKRDSNHKRAQKEGKERDGFVCMICGKYCEKAQGHHVIYVREGGPASRKNMVTLCDECHKDYHSGILKIDLGTF